MQQQIIPVNPEKGSAQAASNEDLSMRLQQLESDMLKVTLICDASHLHVVTTWRHPEGLADLVLLQVQNILLLHNERWQAVDGAAGEAAAAMSPSSGRANA